MATMLNGAAVMDAVLLLIGKKIFFIILLDLFQKKKQINIY
jgi:hypothetical protein